MATRRMFLNPPRKDAELEKLLKNLEGTEVSEEEYREQRVSFAYGNAPETSHKISKDEVRKMARSYRMMPR